MRLQLVKENILYRPDFSNIADEWYFPEEKRKYENDLSEGKLDPIYHTNTLMYNYNSMGYRTAEFDTFKDQGFVLVFGCSYTEGVGLHEEHIWHSHITKNHNIRVMNLGIGGTGSDAIRFNSALYLANKMPKPRLVIFQWPGFYRRLFSQAEDESGRSMLAIMPTIGLDDEVTSTYEQQDRKHIAMKMDEKWFVERWIAYPDEMRNRVFQDILSSITLFRTWNVPVISFAWDEFNFKEEDCAMNTYKNILDVKLINTNTVHDLRARDALHPGRNVHKRVYDIIKPKLERYL